MTKECANAFAAGLIAAQRHEGILSNPYPVGSDGPFGIAANGAEGRYWVEGWCAYHANQEISQWLDQTV